MAIAVALQISDLSSLLDADLDDQTKLNFDAAALLLNIPVNGCFMLATRNGLLLHTPSYPGSLKALIALQDQGFLENCVARLSQGTLNKEMIELLLPNFRVASMHSS